MSADQPLMICTAVLHPALHFGDMQITYCNEPAAEKHGYGAAAQLAGRFLSELQSVEFREAGKIQGFLRQHGYPVDTGYCTVMQAEDGEVIGHHRQVVSWLADGHGGLSYAVTIELVQELSPVAVPDVAAYGYTPDAVDALCGRYTMQQLKDQARTGTIDLPYSENLRTILSRCNDLSSLFGYDTDDTGLDLALSGQVVWTLYGRSAGMVKIWQTCEACGWRWATPEFQAQECPQCRVKMPPRLAMD